MDTIDEFLHTVANMVLDQTTDYNNIVIKRVAHGIWILQLDQGKTTVAGTIRYCQSLPVEIPGGYESHMEWQYEAHTEIDHIRGITTSASEAWKEALNAMQQIADQQ